MFPSLHHPTSDKFFISPLCFCLCSFLSFVSYSVPFCDFQFSSFIPEPVCGTSCYLMSLLLGFNLSASNRRVFVFLCFYFLLSFGSPQTDKFSCAFFLKKKRKKSNIMSAFNYLHYGIHFPVSLTFCHYSTSVCLSFFLALYFLSTIHSIFLILSLSPSPPFAFCRPCVSN